MSCVKELQSTHNRLGTLGSWCKIGIMIQSSRLKHRRLSSAIRAAYGLASIIRASKVARVFLCAQFTFRTPPPVSKATEQQERCAISMRDQRAENLYSSVATLSSEGNWLEERHAQSDLRSFIFYIIITNIQLANRCFIWQTSPRRLRVPRAV